VMADIRSLGPLIGGLISGAEDDAVFAASI
jgi:hypothetical protein